MTFSPTLTCPKCRATLRTVPIGYPFEEETNPGARGTILKCCPRCRVWSWMALQPQEAS